MKDKIAIVIGTRPEIIKMSPIVRELTRKNINFFILHTNQHFSENMDKIFFEELKLPQPKYNLGVNSLSHGKMIGKMLIKIEDVLLKEKPDWVLVQGDTNTVMSGAIIAQRLGIKVGHIEAGLRSYDRTMPEEINRIVTDHVSDALFCPTNKQKKIAINEGIGTGKVFVTGNTIVDAVKQNMKIAKKSNRFKKFENKDYFVLTLHRPSNVDDKDTLREILVGLQNVVDKYEYSIYFPIHPRTKNNMKKFKLSIDESKIKLMNPVGYLEMLSMMENAKLIFTDSGGIQEEACILKVPCVTLRDSTERPETLEVGSNMLAGNKAVDIVRSTKIMLKRQTNWRNPFGDGKAAEKIVDIIGKYEHG